MKTIPRYIPNFVDFAPKDHRRPNWWQLEQPFAQITSDGHIIICRPWQRTDGASIPRVLWPVLGHPFHKGNAFWSQPHDGIYNDTAVVLRLAELPGITPEELLHEVSNGRYVYDSLAHKRVAVSRKWADWAMREAMWLSKESRLKRFTAWSGVRAGGRMPWRAARKVA